MYIPTATVPVSEGYPQLAVGSYPAKIIEIIDLGTQENEMDKNAMAQRRFLIKFEAYAEDKAYNLLKEINYYISADGAKKTSQLKELFSMSKITSNNIFELINKMFMISTGLTSGGNTKIATVSPLPKLMADLEYPSEAEPKLFYLDEFNKFSEIFDKLPEFVRKKIELSPEYQELVAGN